MHLSHDVSTKPLVTVISRIRTSLEMNKNKPTQLRPEYNNLCLLMLQFFENKIESVISINKLRFIPILLEPTV